MEKRLTAYERGWQDFYGREFLVDENVLIPRPETEMMVDAVLSLAGRAILPGVLAPEAKIPATARILEVGTGSGCVAITLKLELPEAEVSAVDISEKALEVEKKNAANLGARLHSLIISDLLENVKFTPVKEGGLGKSNGASVVGKNYDTDENGSSDKFDVICANLPYVDEDWEWIDHERLAEEPRLALFAEDGGLETIKRLIQQAAGRTRFLILEADPCQHDKIIQYAAEFGFQKTNVRGFILEFESEK